MILVSVEKAFDHLREEIPAADTAWGDPVTWPLEADWPGLDPVHREIVSKVSMASDIVLDYIDQGEYWTEDTAPEVVQAAVLLVLSALYDGGEIISPTVRHLLARVRVPGMA